MARGTLRDSIDLVNAALLEAGRDVPWEREVKDSFGPSFVDMLRRNPNLKEKLDQFIAFKLIDPLSQRFGKHDRPFTGPFLQGLQHCHLGPDAILIYSLAGRKLNLIYMCQHSEIEGKRMKGLGKRLADYLVK